MDHEQGPLEEPAGEWFVNRRQELDLFWEWATGIPHPGRNSYALVGLRRTGKTAILHKTFNRLFNEQERVLPIYISFAEYLHRVTPINAYEFAEEYFGSYIRSYLAFHYRQPHFHRDAIKLPELRHFARKISDDLVLKALQSYDLILSNDHGQVRGHNLMQWVINIPKGYARGYDLPTAMIIDEFQVLTRVYNPDNGLIRDLTDSFQHASETRYAPLLVSGSSVSMMVGQALGGLLSGRFRSRPLKPLSQEYTLDLVFRLGKSKGLPVTEDLALTIWEMTQGYPYSIECILQSASPDLARLPDLTALNDILFFELTDGLGSLREHYEDEYGKYIRELNGDDITRKILFWLTNYPGEHLHPRRIAETLSLNFLQVRESLEKLYKLDIIQRATSSTFWGPTDPLLLEFLRYDHYVDLDDLTPQDAEAKLRHELKVKQGEMNRQAGHFTEIIVAGVMNNYDYRTVEGTPYFSLSGPVILPHIVKIHRREGVIKGGELYEIDVIGEYKLNRFEEGNAALGAWLVSVRYRKEKMGEGEVQKFIAQVTAVQAEKQYGEVTPWYFSKAGFTETAIKKLTAEGIYFSDLDQFNALADLFGLLPLVK